MTLRHRQVEVKQIRFVRCIFRFHLQTFSFINENTQRY